MCNIDIGEEIAEDSMERLMLESQEKWVVVARYAGAVMRLKEQEERRRENELKRFEYKLIKTRVL